MTALRTEVRNDSYNGGAELEHSVDVLVKRHLVPRG